MPKEQPIKNLPLLPKQRKAFSEKLAAVAELQKQKAKIAELNRKLFDLGLIHNVGEEGVDELQIMVICW
jgi:hypothetical protein